MFIPEIVPKKLALLGFIIRLFGIFCLNVRLVDWQRLKTERENSDTNAN